MRKDNKSGGRKPSNRPADNLEGKRINYLQIIKAVRIKGRWYYYAKCTLCNNITNPIRSDHIKSGHTQSCGCLSIYNEGPKREEDRRLILIKQNYRNYVKSFINIDECITLEEFTEMVKQPCYYCGNMDIKYEGENRYEINGIDRLYSNINYIISNCVPCCKKCNYYKMQQTPEEFVNWILRFNSYQGIIDITSKVESYVDIDFRKYTRRKYIGSRSYAKKKEWDFDINYDEWMDISEKPCFYCGGYVITKDNRVVNGVGRLLSNEGYTRCNVVPCCKDCNLAKNNSSVSEFLGHMINLLPYALVNRIL